MGVGWLLVGMGKLIIFIVCLFFLVWCRVRLIVCLVCFSWVKLLGLKLLVGVICLVGIGFFIG